jgi:hypothetical protein
VAIVRYLFAVSFHRIRGATVLCRKVRASLPEVRQRVGVCTEGIPVVSAHRDIVSGKLGLCQVLLDGLSQEELDTASTHGLIPCRCYLQLRSQLSSLPCYCVLIPPVWARNRRGTFAEAAWVGRV